VLEERYRAKKHAEELGHLIASKNRGDNDDNNSLCITHHSGHSVCMILANNILKEIVLLLFSSYRRED
jgi:hypothetical protein